MAIQVRSTHSNIAHRLHGGMMMALQTMAMKSITHAATASPDPGACPALVSFHCNLLDSALQGDWVLANAHVVRAARTAVFATGELVCGDRVLMNATAVYRRDESPPEAARGGGDPQPARAYEPMIPTESFSAHMGPIDEWYDDAGNRFGAVRIREKHLCPVSHAVAADGVLLFFSDIFLGRHAKVHAGMPCVTVSMTVAKLGNALLGDLVEIETRITGKSDEWVVVQGTLSTRGIPIANVDSLWKVLGPRRQ